MQHPSGCFPVHNNNAIGVECRAPSWVCTFVCNPHSLEEVEVWEKDQPPSHPLPPHSTETWLGWVKASTATLQSAPHGGLIRWKTEIKRRAMNEAGIPSSLAMSGRRAWNYASHGLCALARQEICTKTIINLHSAPLLVCPMSISKVTFCPTFPANKWVPPAALLFPILARNDVVRTNQQLYARAQNKCELEMERILSSEHT